MRTALILVSWTLLTVLTPSPIPAAEIEEQDPAYYHTGELAGSLRSTAPPLLFDADPQHLWNRLFAAVTIRPSLLRSVKGGPPVARIEGGDRIEFFGWGGFPTIMPWPFNPGVMPRCTTLIRSAIT